MSRDRARGLYRPKFWLRVLTELRNCGVKDVLFVCCDGLKGSSQAIEAAFPKATVQTCTVHQVRNSLAFVPWQDRKKVGADLRAIYTASSEADCCRSPFLVIPRSLHLG